MIDFEYREKYGVYDLKKLITLLRSNNGCPWDRVQTHESIRRNFLEEAYETVEAIDEKDPEHLCEELGDVLTQVVFHSSIEEDAGNFDLDDVADMVCKKLILRHPHVFSDGKAKDADEVLVKWDEIKRVEKNQETVTSSLEAVAKSLPALWRAEKIQKKAAKTGFAWPDVTGALAKLEEEMRELLKATETGSGAEEELGDLLFAAVNVARYLDADPEKVLGQACDKFTRRFGRAEESAELSGRSLEDLPLDVFLALYEEAKAEIPND